MPRLHEGAPGPRTVSSVTAPVADLLLDAREQRRRRAACICVAQAVESARTVSTPSVKVTGSTWAAMSGPTISGQRPMTEPTATSTFQPRSTSSRSSWSPSRVGSRPSRPAPDSVWAESSGRGRLRGFMPGRRPFSRAAARARARAEAAASASLVSSSAAASPPGGSSLMATDFCRSGSGRAARAGCSDETELDGIRHALFRRRSGTSAPTAAVMSTCSQSSISSASRSRRPESSSAKTSSSTSTGSSPRSRASSR